jgi:hypothetical protein
MFRARKELAEAKYALGVMEGERNGLLRIANEAKVEAAQERKLRLTAEESVRELVQLREANHELDKKNAVLMERLDLVVNHGIGTPTPRLHGPTSLTEEAEDALFAFRNGSIDKGDLEQTLAEAGFDQTEIEFELADYPHHAVPQ